jgi:hypothetical protein
MSRAATCKWSAPLAQPGQWMLKEIFRYITREGGRLATRVQKASVWSSAAQRPVDFRRSDDNSLPGGGTPTKATGSPGTLLAREPGDLAIDRSATAAGPYREGEEP